MENENMNRIRLAAMDLDGTLLGSDHGISEANRRAVRRLQAAGSEVVLASGRHHKAMRKYAEGLPGVRWMVSCQGGEVSDVSRAHVISRSFLPTPNAKQALELGRSLGFTTLAYGVDGVFTDTKWNFELNFYAELSGHRPIEVRPDELLTRELFKVIWMGEPEAITRVAPEEVAAPTVQVVRTQARFLEFMPTSVSKATALATLTSRLGILAEETAVFGDGDNDVPMFEWAGISVAMPHGWPRAVASAKYVAPEGPEDTALARGVELVLNARSQQLSGLSAFRGVSQPLEAAALEMT
jgi:Cof subfamily protein (haloacid dehalogenase superfamily)